MYAGARPTSNRNLSAVANGAPAYSVAEVSRHAPRSGRFPHRLNFYERPPTEEITVEQFEEWAIDRLRCRSSACPIVAIPPLNTDASLRAVLADIESAQARNKSFEEIKVIVGERAKTYMPLSSDTARSVDVEAERKKDQYSHFVLRLAFCRS